jgi:hypothetical protein
MALSPNKMFSATEIIKMFEFLIDNIFVMFGGQVFQQLVFPLVPTVLLFSRTYYFIATCTTDI